jgi:SAM-dependent methyltransferase
MLKKIKNRIKRYIDREIEKRQDKFVTSQQNPEKNNLWESQIAINSPPKEFDNLLSVSNYTSGINHIAPESLSLEKPISEYIDADQYPLPATEDREGYMGDRHYEYWLGGLSDYLNIKNRLLPHGYALNPGFSVYDLGCASGRVVRHFLCQERDLDLWASDINLNHVEWVTRFLEQKICTFQNHALPHLPMEDNYFDLVYAFSVFSHIDAFETAWLLELKRIIKPGGLAYLTIHSDHTWRIMKDGGARPIYEALLNHPEFHEGLLQSKLPKQKMVFRYPAEHSYRANVFYDIDFIERIWGQYFDILEIYCEGHNYQDAVLLKKRS